MSGTFVHSVKVPRLYKITAKTVQNVSENGASLKQLIYEKKHPNIAGTYALALTTLQHATELNELLRKTQLLFKEPRLDPWLARVLITELLWGKKALPSEAKPVKTIVSYENILSSELINLDSKLHPDTLGTKVKKPRYVRINTLKTTVRDAISDFESEGWYLLPKCRNYSDFQSSLSKLSRESQSFAQDFHVPELLVFPSGTHFHDHPGYQSGAILLQDKASCLPSHLLDAKPGSTVLDMCAAPGMKTTHLAAILENRGKIFAFERNDRRYDTLCTLIASSGATCVETFKEDAMTVNPDKYPDIEYILVDPSCSGSGLLDRVTIDPIVKCAPERLRKLQSFQVLLLRHALLNFPTVKRVVYSTCSLYPEENEMVVDEILEHVGKSYKLLSVGKLLSGNWKNFGSEDYACGKKCLYARSETDHTNGFFVAVFERNFEVPLPEYKREKAFTAGKGATNVVREKNLPRGKENSAKVKENSVRDEDENFAKKKKKKKNKMNGGEMSESMTLNTHAPEELPEAVNSKKRDKRKASSITEVEEVVIIESPINDGEAKKKKKKKKKQRLESQQEDSANIPDPECLLIEEPEEGKKRKKKKRSRDEVDPVPNETVDDAECSLIVEPKLKKEKKKKKRPES